MMIIPSISLIYEVQSPYLHVDLSSMNSFLTLESNLNNNTRIVFSFNLLLFLLKVKYIFLFVRQHG